MGVALCKVGCVFIVLLAVFSVILMLVIGYIVYFILSYTRLAIHWVMAVLFFVFLVMLFFCSTVCVACSVPGCFSSCRWSVIHYVGHVFSMLLTALLNVSLSVLLTVLLAVFFTLLLAVMFTDFLFFLW